MANEITPEQVPVGTPKYVPGFDESGEWVKILLKNLLTQVDAMLSDTSDNPVQNKVVKAALDAKVNLQTLTQALAKKVDADKGSMYGPGINHWADLISDSGIIGRISALQQIISLSQLQSDRDDDGYASSLILTNDLGALRGQNRVLLWGKNQGEHLIQTPALTSNDTQIATTEWANQRIAEMSSGEANAFGVYSDGMSVLEWTSNRQVGIILPLGVMPPIEMKGAARLTVKGMAVSLRLIMPGSTSPYTTTLDFGVKELENMPLSITTGTSAYYCVDIMAARVMPRNLGTGASVYVTTSATPVNLTYQDIAN